MTGKDIYQFAAVRIAKGDTDPARRSVSLREALGEEDYAEYLAMKSDDGEKMFALLDED